VTLRATDPAELPAGFREFDAVWIRLANRITADMFQPAMRCRLLIVPTTGIDHIDLDACERYGVRVLCLKGEVEFLRTVRATAELTLALTLALLRHIPAAAASTRNGEWDRDRFRGREIFGKTVGIIGMGRLGTIAAGYFQSLGARVVGYDPRTDYPHEAADRCATLVELLQQSDIVCLMARYDAGTRHLLNHTAFAAMRPRAVLVNTSRGGIVDESALLDALKSGRLAGAALDVLDGEPNITAEHPLIQYSRQSPSLLIVPHIGGNTFESFEKTELFLAEKAAQLLATA